jgi:hypothetical protein
MSRELVVHFHSAILVFGPLPQIMASQFLQPGRSSAAMVIEELVESAVERAYEAVKYVQMPSKIFRSFCAVWVYAEPK